MTTLTKDDAERGAEERLMPSDAEVEAACQAVRVEIIGMENIDSDRFEPIDDKERQIARSALLAAARIREAQGGERGEEVMTYDDVLSALKGCSSEHQIMLSVLRSIKEDPFFCKLNASIRQRVRDAIQNYAEPEDRKE